MGGEGERGAGASERGGQALWAGEGHLAGDGAGCTRSGGMCVGASDGV